MAPDEALSIIRDQEPEEKRKLGAVAERTWRDDPAPGALKPS